ncbi:hypothetical protein CEXT_432001 [Caerostris extrusa]|uniref:Uncharacterized protein n=1 Tax=Caerostris extrusa TaxID=172846 RepID=A0AAV4Y162_CAEEX|nr:hypothetical protein CEXT_432001 [Caerostris extrusa]
MPKSQLLGDFRTSAENGRESPGSDAPEADSRHAWKKRALPNCARLKKRRVTHSAVQLGRTVQFGDKFSSPQCHLINFVFVCLLVLKWQLGHYSEKDSERSQRK